jgi:hypothetical protein
VDLRWAARLRHEEEDARVDPRSRSHRARVLTARRCSRRPRARAAPGSQLLTGARCGLMPTPVWSRGACRGGFGEEI